MTHTVRFIACLLLMPVLLAGLNACRKGPGKSTLQNKFAPFTPSEDLGKDFKAPPQQAKPWVFWWWLEGNIDEAGLRKDLAAMKETGIAGAIIFDAGSSSYTAVRRTAAGPSFMSDRWQTLFKYAVTAADSLGLQLSLNIGSGWNDGGPWVTPDLAAKKLVWSVLKVKGPAQLDQALPLPANVFRQTPDAAPYFKPVATLAVKLGDSSSRVTPLRFFSRKAVHRVGAPQTPDGYDWNIFLQEDTATLDQYDAKLKDITDISRQVDSAGNIRWQVPAGDYAVLRFGYTGTGSRVSTSSPGGEGLAIDYMNPAAMDLQFAKVPGVLIKEVAPFAGRSWRYVHDDSWELGAANWTQGFRDAFKQEQGYDLLPYLPVLAGLVIENKDISNRFLYDFRRTIADLIAENHYARFRDLAHNEGLGLHPEGGGPHPAPIDALKNLGRNDIPMGEFWAKVKTHRVQDYERIFVKQSASAAHIYGKRYVQAEGPTSIGPQWEMDPQHLKPTIDRAFCEGLNRLVLHTFTHSPDSAGKPGYEYFAGTHFNPNITWWNEAPAYTGYIARCQTLLQQGLFVGDVCFYYGDNVPNQVHLKRIPPSLGPGYDYDVTNTEVILTRMSVKDHRIVLPDGMQYEVLVLPDRTAIPLEVLKKIKQLVAAGATVIGPKPQHIPGLTGYPGSEAAIRAVADELWGPVDGAAVTEHSYGKGKIVWGKTIREVLKERGIAPDFSVKGKNLLADVDYIHRRYDNYDIYFVCNRRDSAQWMDATFRVTGAAPALWFPDDGKIVPQQVYESAEKTTTLPLCLPPYGSVFVVFKQGASPRHVTSVAHNDIPLYPPAGGLRPEDAFTPFSARALKVHRGGIYTLTYADGSTQNVAVPLTAAATQTDSAWKVYFSPEWGGPGAVTFDTLLSWPQSPLKGIKYYAGTAVYHNTFHVNAKDTAGCRLILDLGEVRNLARVKVNGQAAGIIWKDPFTVDVTPFIRAGVNQLEVSVVNLWPNRLIGDQFLPPEKRFTHTNVIKFTQADTLMPSGLLGPVRIRFAPLLKTD